MNVTLDGASIWFIAVYDVSRNYGGPEEGGWWYDSGTLIEVHACSTYEQAEQLREALREDYPDSGKRYSVLGGDDYDISIGVEIPAAFFPEEIPHYE